MNTFKINDRVEVKHVYNPFAYKRYTNIPDTVTWHPGTIIGVQLNEVKVKLDNEFNGYKECVVYYTEVRKL